MNLGERLMNMRANRVLIVAVASLALVSCGEPEGTVTRAEGGNTSTAPSTEIAAGAWRPVPDAPVPNAYGIRAVWTGEALIVWGGIEVVGAPSNVGASYSPKHQAWEVLNPAPVGGRINHSMIWTGREVIVWGGKSASLSGELADGAAYNPASKE